MNDLTYNLFCDLIHREGGIALGTEKKELLSGRIKHRMHKLGLESPEQYLSTVRHNESEVIELLDAISTNHTFFFREVEHFGVFVEFLRRRLALGQRRFRIWCAASSSGEEPYSLAITALDLFDQLAVSVDFKLLATDISTKVLALAQEGWYSSERCACLPAIVRTKHFRPVAHGQIPGFQVNQRIRDMTLFRRLNLIEFPYPQHGPIDAIFCRNVMIYFDEPTRRSIIKQMQPLLPEHGLLFVGLTESLLGSHDGFEYVSPSVYRPV